MEDRPGPRFPDRNTEEEIQDRTRAALDAIKPWRDQSVSGLTSEAMWANWRETARRAIGDAAVNSGLLGLDGVGYPMATAILAILEPTVWPVLDRWGTLTVFGPRSVGGARPNRHWQHAAAYEAYARHLAVQGAAVWGADLSVHQLDQKAMNLAKRGGALPPGWHYAPLPTRTYPELSGNDMMADTRTGGACAKDISFPRSRAT